MNGWIAGISILIAVALMYGVIAWASRRVGMGAPLGFCKFCGNVVHEHAVTVNGFGPMHPKCEANVSKYCPEKLEPAEYRLDSKEQGVFRSALRKSTNILNGRKGDCPEKLEPRVGAWVNEAAAAQHMVDGLMNRDVREAFAQQRADAMHGGRGCVFVGRDGTVRHVPIEEFERDKL